MICCITRTSPAPTDDLLKRLEEAFKPELFVNHYGSSEVYTFTTLVNAPAKPGSAGKAGINQRVRVVVLGADGPGVLAPAGEEGEIIVSLAGDESFEGYWKRHHRRRKRIAGRYRKLPVVARSC